MTKIPAEHSLRQSLAKLESEAILHQPTHDAGVLPVRQWQNPGAPKVVLMHGGSGSWMHWVRNIRELQADFDVYALDLPGLGDADQCPVPSDAMSAATVTGDVLSAFLDEPFHIVAFSFGCTISAMLMKRMASQLRSVILTGPAAVGNLPRRVQMQPLIKRTPEMNRDEVLAAQRENVARLMIHDRSKIDDLSVIIQDINTSKARFSSPQYARSTLILDSLEGTSTPLYVIYGDHDAPAYPDLEARRQVFASVRPDAEFELIENAGHWLQYEMPDVFNERCRQWLLRNAS